jgi:aryl-alcohol dehydrogenase-like predicted oxidoreductase
MERGESLMEKRKLGIAGPEVPVICLGGNVYGWTLPEREAFRQLDVALDGGLNFVDTADVYSRWVPVSHSIALFPRQPSMDSAGS